MYGDRYNELFKRYIEKALTHNPMITQLMDEYMEEETLSFIMNFKQPH